MKSIAEMATLSLQTGVLTDEQRDDINCLLHARIHNDEDLMLLDRLIDALLSQKVLKEDRTPALSLAA